MGTTKADKVKKVTKGKEDQTVLEDQISAQTSATEAGENKPDGKVRDTEREERAQKAQNALLQIEGKPVK